MNHTLPTLQHELVRTHRARLARRRAIGAAAVTLPAIALAFALFVPSQSFFGGTGFQPVSPILAESTPPPQPLPLGERPVASPRPGEGYSSITIQPMSDDELLAALADAGHPSGLITINGHTTVVANRFPDAPSPFAPFGASINAAP